MASEQERRSNAAAERPLPAFTLGAASFVLFALVAAIAVAQRDAAGLPDVVRIPLMFSNFQRHWRVRLALACSRQYSAQNMDLVGHLYTSSSSCCLLSVLAGPM
eukprot:1613944-Rhodomonas_salina.2